MDTTILIIGTGLAGYTLAREVRKQDAEIRLCLLTADDGAFYSKPMLSTAFAMGKDAKTLVNQSHAVMAKRLKADILTQREAVEIDPVHNKIRLADGELVQFDKLVLAVGASPIRLDYAGDAAHVPLSVNNLADYARFRERITHAKRIAVVGPGLIGCEFACDLHNSGREVHVIGPDTTPLGRLVPMPVGHAIQDALTQGGIHLHLQTAVTHIRHHDTGFILDLGNGTQLQADAILSAVGLRPNLLLARQAELATQAGIVVNDYLQTSQDNIYALGDCAEINGRVMPYVSPILHGAKALSKTLTGQPTEVVYPLMPVSIKTSLYPIELLLPEASIEGHWEYHPQQDGIKALYYDTNAKLHGFVLGGSATHAKAELLKACQSTIL